MRDNEHTHTTGKAMSTTLEITFRCMCLFVTDNEEQRVHVLMPSTDACGHGDHAAHGEHGEHAGEGESGAAPIDPHVVRLVFPMAGGRLNADADAFVERPDVDGRVDFREMEGWSLVLPGTGVTTEP